MKKPRDLSADRAQAIEITPVSAAALARLDRFAALLSEWQAKINLIAESTLPHLWTRHIADSLQLSDLAPAAKVWIDLGSGAGLPGIPIACTLPGPADAVPTDVPEILPEVLHDDLPAVVHLVESNMKKAAFLREAIRVTGAPARVHAMRIHEFVDSFTGRADVVTARALAPLKSLCDQAFPLIAQGAVGLFPKGRDVEAELTEATKYWNMRLERVPSRTDEHGSIVIVRHLEPRKSGS